ncbi:MAG: HBL/NHE enterotoxin family protein [Pyrinomonadaceae bacterium]
MATVDLSLDAASEKLRLFTFIRNWAQLIGCLHSTLNAFFPLYDESQKPDWYAPVNENLESLKRTSHSFLNDLAPELTALPQSFISFSNVVAAAVPSAASGIESLISATGDQRAGLADQVVQVIGQMVGEARTQGANLSALEAKLRVFRTALADEVTAFSSGAQNVTTAMVEEQARVVALTNDIVALQNQIAERYAKLIEQMQLDQDALNGAALGLPYAYGINRWTTGVTLFIMTGVITIAEDTSSVTEIVTAMNQIMDKQSELGAEAQDIFALNLLATGSKQMLEIEQHGKLTLTGFAQTLTDLADELTVVQGKVESLATTAEDLRTINQALARLGFESNDLSDYCQDLQDAALAAVDVPLAVVMIGAQSTGVGG